ncbi:CNT_collapsed_G0015690.mRNA.1.CDS.1 [Saccharomyces cerevisiae]|nr:CNT_collapsed_G0015690.mRNA.1.CDS.1 [Saccharomyces cerevisiae]
MLAYPPFVPFAFRRRWVFLPFLFLFPSVLRSIYFVPPPELATYPLNPTCQQFECLRFTASAFGFPVVCIQIGARQPIVSWLRAHPQPSTSPSFYLIDWAVSGDPPLWEFTWICASRFSSLFSDPPSLLPLFCVSRGKEGEKELGKYRNKRVGHKVFVIRGNQMGATTQKQANISACRYYFSSHPVELGGKTRNLQRDITF